MQGFLLRFISYFCLVNLIRKDLILNSMKYIFLLIILFCSNLHAQIVKDTLTSAKDADTIIVDSGKKDSMQIFKPTINDYLIQKQWAEKKIFDTVMTADKTYIFSQYNNKDNFGKVQFSNIGAGFNPLSYEVMAEQNLALLPSNKGYNLLAAEDVLYYDVKTPTASFIYHNAMRNGAALRSTYTQNIGKRFNFALEYAGLRSQGIYRNYLASNNNTIFSGHYVSKSGNYELFAHYLHQNVNNQENGGIVDDDLFQAGDSDYSNKWNAQVNLENSSSQFSYRRYYLSHQFSPFNSEKFPFRIRHTLSHQGNKYYYTQGGADAYWYDLPAQIVNDFPASTKKYSDNFSNTVSLVFDNAKFKLDAGVKYQTLKFGLNEIALSTLSVPAEMKESRIGAVGNLQVNLFDKIALKSFLEFSNGSQFGSYLRTANALKFEPVQDYFVDAHVNFQTSTPSFNYLANTSIYRKYNYYLQDAKSQAVMDIGGSVNLKWFKTQIFANYYRIDNYTYFNSDGQPMQSEGSVNISQIGGDATFSYGKFHFNTRLQFQDVLSNGNLLPLPSFIGRGNLYFQSRAFKNAAEIQAGIKVYYFTKFASREYFPIVNEYILPGNNSFSIGGKPIADVYFNMKVKKMFFFIEGQQIGNLVAPNTAYAFPHYPVYDFRLNLGVVWYLFN